MSTVYPLDFLAKTLSGNGYQIQKRFAIPSGGTRYFVLDLGVVSEGTCVFGFPITAGITAGHAHLDTYSCTSYTQGTALEVLPLNPKTGSNNEGIFYEATSPVGQTSLREYAIGTESTRQNAGGGFVTNDNIKILNNAPLVFEFINQDTEEIEVSFGYVWFECLG